MVKDVSNNSYVQASAINDYRQIKQFVQQKEQQVESLDNKLSFATEVGARRSQTHFSALEAIPTFRRVSSIPEKFKDNEYISAAGLAGLALINLPEDWRDIKGAGKQIWSKVDKKFTYDPIYDRKNYQHSFSFFRGTLLDKYLKNKIEKGSKWAKKLIELDKSLYKTKFGNFIKEKFNVRVVDKQKTEIVNKMGRKAWASKFGGGFFKQMTGNAMKRIPLLSVIALGVLELPKIFGAHKEGNNLFQKADETAKQTVKSGINVTSVLAGIGYGGAIGQRCGGAFGSLVGMGAGAILGGEVSKKLQDIIA